MSTGVKAQMQLEIQQYAILNPTASKAQTRRALLEIKTKYKNRTNFSKDEEPLSYSASQSEHIDHQFQSFHTPSASQPSSSVEGHPTRLRRSLSLPPNKIRVYSRGQHPFTSQPKSTAITVAKPATSPTSSSEQSDSGIDTFTATSPSDDGKVGFNGSASERESFFTYPLRVEPPSLPDVKSDETSRVVKPVGWEKRTILQRRLFLLELLLDTTQPLADDYLHQAVEMHDPVIMETIKGFLTSSVKSTPQTVMQGIKIDLDIEVDDYTALMVAFEEGSLFSIEFLLSRGATISEDQIKKLDLKLLTKGYKELNRVEAKALADFIRSYGINLKFDEESASATNPLQMISEGNSVEDTATLVQGDISSEAPLEHLQKVTETEDSSHSEAPKEIQKAKPPIELQRLHCVKYQEHTDYLKSVTSVKQKIRCDQSTRDRRFYVT